MTPADIIGACRKNGLSIASISYDLDEGPVTIAFHGVEGVWLERGISGWRVASAGVTLGPTLVWDRAEALRREARAMDGLLGVLADLGQRHPGDTEAA